MLYHLIHTYICPKCTFLHPCTCDRVGTYKWVRGNFNIYQGLVTYARFRKADNFRCFFKALNLLMKRIKIFIKWFNINVQCWKILLIWKYCCIIAMVLAVNNIFKWRFKQGTFRIQIKIIIIITKSSSLTKIIKISFISWWASLGMAFSK